MNGLLEILTNKHWMSSPDFVNAIRPVLQKNLSEHVALSEEKKVHAVRLYASNRFEIVSEDSDNSDNSENSEESEMLENQPFINLLYVLGPITRNGGACSYGSVDHRDLVMRAADNPNCIAHVFHINTPGGSAWAKNDYQQAIDYAHAQGQKVYAFVDGMCCSAGMYLASMCDERYYMHPRNQIGCIGVMAAFYTEKDGSYNKFTNETYHEIYEKESFDKNRQMRDIANDQNDEKLQEELTKLGNEFRADIMKACPNATDEHIHGKVFDAIEVTGILMDGQSTLRDLFTKIINDAALAGNQAAKKAQQSTIFHNKKDEVMTNKYQNLASMMGVNELVVTNEGTHLDVSLLDTLQTNIEALQAKADKVEGLENELLAARQDLATANETHQTEIKAKEDEIATLNGRISENETTVNSLNEELKGAKDSLATAEQTIAERDQTIASLNEQIQDLENGTGKEPATGESPSGNGEGADAAHQSSNAPQWDPTKSATENKKIFDAYAASLKALAK